MVTCLEVSFFEDVLFVGGAIKETECRTFACIWALKFEQEPTLICKSSSIRLEGEISLLQRTDNLDVLFAACFDKIIVCSFSGLSFDTLSQIQIQSGLDCITEMKFQSNSLFCKVEDSKKLFQIEFPKLRNLFDLKNRKLEEPREIMNHIDDYSLKSFALPQGIFV